MHTNKKLGGIDQFLITKKWFFLTKLDWSMRLDPLNVIIKM